MALLYPNLGASVADITPPAWRGSAIGIYRFWRDLGYGIGALGLGIVAHLTGALEATFAEVAALCASGLPDRFGRSFAGKQPLAPPYRAIKITGALFHTQGGLVIDASARVLRPDGQPLPNLFAGGGAARGMSGPSRWGYFSGGGLLTAIALGRLAGDQAARIACATTTSR